MEDAGVEIDEVTSMTDLEPDISERVSQLKGAQRIRFDRVGDKIVAISVGSAYESSVCKGMLAIGADVAFVGSQRDQHFRLSARARPEMVRMGLHLGKLLEDVGTETSNDGGGHGGAAGLVGVGDVEAILNICMHRSMDFLREKKRGRDPWPPRVVPDHRRDLMLPSISRIFSRFSGFLTKYSLVGASMSANDSATALFRSMACSLPVR